MGDVEAVVTQHPIHVGEQLRWDAEALVLR